MHHADPDRLRRDLTHLVQDIGVRLAGTPGEQQAADYVAAQGRAAGAQVQQETFPVRSRQVAEEHLELLVDGVWTAFPCSLFSSTPGTDGLTLEAETVVHTPTDYQRADLSHLTGKAVIHWGTHITSRDAYRRLIEARPAFLMMVDIRYPGSVPLADGMFPAYTATIGAVPTLNVAYQQAWDWVQRGATRARCRVVGGMVPGTSQNVILDLPGTDLADEILYVGGHHDTQAASPGADDNGTGTIGVMELARLLAPLPRRRTIRLICFGAEEQLSVGSAAYVRTHRAEVEARGRLMFNLDSYGTLVGWLKLYLAAPDEFEVALRPYLNAQEVYYTTTDVVFPYADHFPFAVAGVPGLFYHAENCIAGRFFHHRPDDDLSRVSFPSVARHLTGVGHFLHAMSNADTLPWPRTELPHHADFQRQWTDLFGGW